MKLYKAMFSLDFIIKKISLSECLLCETNLNVDLHERDWHIPLCKKHRIIYLDKLTNKILKDGSKNKGTNPS